MDKELKKSLIENNRKVSDLLSLNENLMIKHGYCPPEKSDALEPFERIHIPSGYIRTADSFEEKYHLKEIVVSDEKRRNIAYCFQLSDFYNYIINHFYLWGSVETMLLKQDYINLVSIMETMIIETAKNINYFCNDCVHCRNCPFHLGTSKIGTMKGALERLDKTGITSLSNEEIDTLKKVYDLRSRVHMNSVKGNEFINHDFTIKQHNVAIYDLEILTDHLYKECVPFYSKCVCGNKQTKKSKFSP